MASLRIFRQLALACMMAIIAAAGHAQDAAPVTQADLTALVEQLGQEANLGDEARTQLSSQLESAQQLLREADGNLQQYLKITCGEGTFYVKDDQITRMRMFSLFGWQVMQQSALST